MVLKWEASKWLLLLLWLAVDFTLGGCGSPVSNTDGSLCTSLEGKLFVTCSCHCTDECSSDLSSSLWSFLHLRCFLPLLWLVKVSSALIGFSVIVSCLREYFSLGGCGGPGSKYFTLGGCADPEIRIIVNWLFEFLSNWSYLHFTFSYLVGA